ncbi:MAG: flagellin [bacterium]
MRINHNISSMVTQASLFRTNRDLSKSLERLSTGIRINRASDDAAGLSVSEQLRTQVRGIAMAKRNAMDGQSLLQIAEGAAHEISGMLQRMRELAVQASNDTLTSTERGYLNVEYRALQDEIDRIADATQYNTLCLINGDTAGFGTTGGGTCILHIGPNNSSTVDQIQVTIDAVDTDSIGVSSGGTDDSNITTSSYALGAVTSVDTAINSINNMRSDLGAYVNRLEYTIDNLDNQSSNMQTAESVIRDVDFAYETTEYTKNQILVQSATAMLAQSNTLPQSVLTLVQG